jgi:hypothetical protein
MNPNNQQNSDSEKVYADFINALPQEIKDETEAYHNLLDSIEAILGNKDIIEKINGSQVDSIVESVKSDIEETTGINLTPDNTFLINRAINKAIAFKNKKAEHNNVELSDEEARNAVKENIDSLSNISQRVPDIKDKLESEVKRHFLKNNPKAQDTEWHDTEISVLREKISDLENNNTSIKEALESSLSIYNKNIEHDILVSVLTRSILDNLEDQFKKQEKFNDRSEVNRIEDGYKKYLKVKVESEKASILTYIDELIYKATDIDLNFGKVDTNTLT